MEGCMDITNALNAANNGQVLMRIKDGFKYARYVVLKTS